MTLQLWQFLLKIKSLQPGDRISCTDCFAIMDLLLLAAELGLDFERLMELADQHLAYCPGCREKLWQKLRELEESSRASL